MLVTRIENSTITDNSAPSDMGSGVAIYRVCATTRFSSSIIAGNANTNVDSLGRNWLISEGYNLVGAGRTTGAFNQSGYQSGVSNPGLRLLALNAPGSTPTHALKPTSPALNAIPPTTNSCGTTVATDQRGVMRPQGSGCDIGAFELKAEPDPNNERCTISGTKGDDELEGTSHSDVICGLGGNDGIAGHGEADIVRGGPGDDGIKVGSGADQLFGEEGADGLDAVDDVRRNDSLNGGGGTDACRGDRGDTKTGCEASQLEG